MRCSVRGDDGFETDGDDGAVEARDELLRLEERNLETFESEVVVILSALPRARITFFPLSRLETLGGNESLS